VPFRALPVSFDSDTIDTVLHEQFSQGVDIVLDYLWDPSAGRLLAAAAKAGKGTSPLRFVQIGTASAATIALPGALLRSSAIEIMGSGIGSVALDSIMSVLARMIGVAATAGFEIAMQAIPLDRIADAWSMENPGPGIVLTVA
jgi:hypothetical protein